MQSWQLGKDVTKGSHKSCLNGATTNWHSRTGDSWLRTIASGPVKIAEVHTAYFLQTIDIFRF